LKPKVTPTFVDSYTPSEQELVAARRAVGELGRPEISALAVALRTILDTTKADTDRHASELEPVELLARRGTEYLLTKAVEVMLVHWETLPPSPRE